MKEVAECIGLWLAEGDSKTKREITFTNSEISLVRLFHRTITSIISSENKPRVYAYLPSKDSEMQIIRGVNRRIYIDARANRPYYLYRLYGRNEWKQWHRAVEKICKREDCLNSILKGFFAVEGNVKISVNYGSRMLRIAQNSRVKVIEKALQHHGIKFRFNPKGSSGYEIWGENNLQNAASIGIADLHAAKKKKLKALLKSFKESHYQNFTVQNKLPRILATPKTARALTKIFGRKISRIQQVLKRLKNQGKVKYFKVGSEVYWVKAKYRHILISQIKYKILREIRSGRGLPAIAKNLGRGIRTIHNRIVELKKLGLIETRNSRYHLDNENIKRIAGVDEAGREIKLQV